MATSSKTRQTVFESKKDSKTKISLSKTGLVFVVLFVLFTAYCFYYQAYSCRVEFCQVVIFIPAWPWTMLGDFMAHAGFSLFCIFLLIDYVINATLLYQLGKFLEAKISSELLRRSIGVDKKRI